jgi:hypothetical protein
MEAIQSCLKRFLEMGVIFLLKRCVFCVEAILERWVWFVLYGFAWKLLVSSLTSGRGEGLGTLAKFLG